MENQTSTNLAIWTNINIELKLKGVNQNKLPAMIPIISTGKDYASDIAWEIELKGVISLDKKIDVENIVLKGQPKSNIYGFTPGRYLDYFDIFPSKCSAFEGGGYII